MKRVCHIMSFVLLLSLEAIAQPGGVRQKLSPNFSVLFPATPQKFTSQQVDYYTLEHTDSIRYVAMVADFKISFGMDSVALAAVKETQKFADELAIGMTSSMKEFLLSPVISGKKNGNTSYAFSGISNNGKNRMQMLIVIIGTKVYTLSCTSAGLLSPVKTSSFLNSGQSEHN